MFLFERLFRYRCPVRSFFGFVYSQKAGVLFLALWVLCFLCTLAIVLSGKVRQRILFVQKLNERLQLRLIAQAGTKIALMQILKYEFFGPCSLKDDWSENPAVFKDIAVGLGSCEVWWIYPTLEGSIRKHWGLLDEERKINVNTCNVDTLQRLFQVVLDCDRIEAQELASSLIDWRDEDSDLTHPSLSAEAPYYAFLSHPYPIKNKDIEVLEELLLVKGFTPEIYSKIKNYVTIYSSGRVNINTAPWPVLVACGLSAELATKIVKFRSGQDGIEATFDDRVINSLAELPMFLARDFGLSEEEKNELAKASADYFTVSSGVFAIQTTARLRGKDMNWNVYCVVDRSGKILYWRES